MFVLLFVHTQQSSVNKASDVPIYLTVLFQVKQMMHDEKLIDKVSRGM